MPGVHGRPCRGSALLPIPRVVDMQVLRSVRKAVPVSHHETHEAGVELKELFTGKAGAR